MSKHSISYCVDLGVLGEQIFDVDYIYSAGYADSRWEPGEPASIEITKVSNDKFDATVCGYIEEFLMGNGYNEFCEQAWPDIEGEMADHAWQQYKDRKIDEAA